MYLFYTVYSSGALDKMLYNILTNILKRFRQLQSFNLIYQIQITQL